MAVHFSPTPPITHTFAYFLYFCMEYCMYPSPFKKVVYPVHALMNTLLSTYYTLTSFSSPTAPVAIWALYFSGAKGKLGDSTHSPCTPQKARKPTFCPPVITISCCLEFRPSHLMSAASNACIVVAVPLSPFKWMWLFASDTSLIPSALRDL